MSIELIVTRGYGNGVVVGSIPDIVLRGYSFGLPIIQDTERSFSVVGVIDDNGETVEGRI